MATLLDAGILGHFGSIFVVLLLFAIIYGILEVTNPFGKDKKGLHALIAFVIGLLFLVSRGASSLVKVMVPWFIVIIIFIFFVMLMFRMFGVDDAKFKDVIADSAVFPWIIIFALLVLIGSLSAVFGQSLLERGGAASSQDLQAGAGSAAGGFQPDGISGTTTTDFGTNILNTFRNPKILGMVFIFLTGAFMMIFLTRAAKQ